MCEAQKKEGRGQVKWERQAKGHETSGMHDSGQIPEQKTVLNCGQGQ
jgi:hypothetical protein